MDKAIVYIAKLCKCEDKVLSINELILLDEKEKEFC